MSQILITGGSGFLGELLKKKMLEQGHFCVNIDLRSDWEKDENLVSIQGDIRDQALLEKVFSEHKFDSVFHCAAILAHEVKDKDFLWSSNVDGTKNVAETAKKHKVPKIAFTSSNCLWAENFHRPVQEDDEPRPVEVYGKSKWEGEKILNQYTDDMDVVVFRCPTIMDSGRLGLLSILFEFIDEGRKVWVVGGGDNKYQFIYAQDLITAFASTLNFSGSAVFNIGSDDVKSFKEVYQYVIDKAGTGARVASLPRGLTLNLMKMAYFMGMSPLGPYQYKMIAEDFVFDTSKIKNKLEWVPTLKNEDMLYNAYKYYHDNMDDIKNRSDVSDHKKAAKMGVIRLLKWFS